MTWEIAQAMEEDAKSMVGGPTGPVQIISEYQPWMMLSSLMMLILTAAGLLRKRTQRKV